MMVDRKWMHNNTVPPPVSVSYYDDDGEDLISYLKPTDTGRIAFYGKLALEIMTRHPRALICFPALLSYYTYIVKAKNNFAVKHGLPITRHSLLCLDTTKDFKNLSQQDL